MERVAYLILTIVVLIGVPLWGFRHHVAARRRGLSYENYLERRIDDLNKKIVADAIRRASLLHPRPAQLRRRVRSAAIACVASLTIAGVAIWFGQDHASARNGASHVVSVALGVGVAAFAQAVWFGCRARAAKRLSKSVSTGVNP